MWWWWAMLRRKSPFWWAKYQGYSHKGLRRVFMSAIVLLGSS